MNLNLAIFIGTLCTVITAQARATTITYTFQENGSNVDLGSTSTFTESGISLTASGFLTSGGSTNLYAKNEGNVGGSSEMGLGTTSDPSGDHEIATSNFIQLTLPTTPPTNFQMVLLASVQSGESANVYFTHTAGTLTGATLIGTISNADGSVTVPGGDQTGYVDITAGKVNVLLSGAVVTVPDAGATVVLLAFALAGIVVIQRIAPNSLRAK
jgi:VPDSG-CTERM motif